LIASIPSPEQSVWFLGPFPLRAYAMFILAGIVVAVWITQKRLEDRGGKPGQALDVAVWAVPFGIVGGRLYHVLSSPQPYFGDGGHPLDALKIWQGGLGIWGGIALGTAAGLWAARRRGIPGAVVLRAATPALPLAQAIGRWGNWWNQELFGKPTTLPWGLKIDAAHRPEAYINSPTFHPTFLYESLWCLALCFALLWVDRTYRPRAGRLFAIYVAGYTFVRFFLERLRIDPAFKVAGLRVNEWVSVIAFALALAYIVLGPKGVTDLAGAPSGAPEGGDAEPGRDEAGVEPPDDTPPFVDENADPELTAALGKYAFSGSFDDLSAPAPAAEPPPEPVAVPDEPGDGAVDEVD